MKRLLLVMLLCLALPLAAQVMKGHGAPTVNTPSSADNRFYLDVETGQLYVSADGKTWEKASAGTALPGVSSNGSGMDVTGSVKAGSGYKVTAGIPSGGTTVKVFGDSISDILAQWGPMQSADNKFPVLVGAALGWTVTNYAVAGTQCQDQKTKFNQYTPDTGDNVLWLSGYNDNRFSGTDAAKFTTYKNCFLSNMLLAATASTAKVVSGGWTEAGSWASASWENGVYRKPGDTNATATATITGTAVSVGGIQQNVLGAMTISVSVDGTVYPFSFTAANSGNNEAFTPWAVLISGLTSGTHTVIVKRTGTADMFLQWIGSNTAGATVYVGNTLRMTAAGYISGGAGSTWGNASDASTAAYNTYIRDTVNLLAASGYKVYYVDADSFYDPTTMVCADNLHPCDNGHAAIAKAFISFAATSIKRGVNIDSTTIEGHHAVDFAQRVSVPSSATAACIPPQFALGGGYRYDCIAPNTWMRVAVATW